MQKCLFSLILTFLCGVWSTAPAAYGSAGSAAQCFGRNLSSQLYDAQAITLFNGDQIAPGYNRLVKRIRPGNTLRFGNGETFKVGELLGGDFTTLIYDLGDGWALRIPKLTDKKMDSGDPVRFIHDFEEMQPELEMNGVRVVEMDSERGVPKQAVVVKKETILFTLKDYLNSEDRDGDKLKLSRSDRKEIENKLIQFAHTTWMFRYIGDFNESQLAYNGKEWVLLDFGANNGASTSVLIRNLKDTPNIFSHLSAEPLEQGRLKPVSNKQLYIELRQKQIDRRNIELRIYEKINDAILEERKKQRRNPKLFKKIKKTGTYEREKD